MMARRIAAAVVLSLALAVPAAAQDAAAQTDEPFAPRVGQAGKDVVWVPTPPALLDLMLDMAGVTSRDFVMDLGSGDGRNIIAAAKRGARGVGVEYNPNMVALSQRLAAEAGVADRATFVEGDMYEADISKASVMAIFLLPSNMDRLQPKFEALAPGSRIVSNTFGFTDWDPDERRRVEHDCSDWCESLLWIVPARIAGTWRLGDGTTLRLTQAQQVLYGSLDTVEGPAQVTAGRVRGLEVTFTIDGDVYQGRAGTNTIEGTVTTPQGASSPFRATHVP